MPILVYELDNQSSAYWYSESELFSVDIVKIHEASQEFGSEDGAEIRFIGKNGSYRYETVGRDSLIPATEAMNELYHDLKGHKK